MDPVESELNFILQFFAFLVKKKLERICQRNLIKHEKNLFVPSFFCVYYDILGTCYASENPFNPTCNDYRATKLLDSSKSNVVTTVLLLHINY